MIPSITSIQLPILKLLENKLPHKIRDVIETLAIQFTLSSEDRSKLTPSGSKPTFDTRVYWAVSNLRNAALLENIERGIFKITRRGLDLLKEDPKEINNSILKKYPEYREFLGLYEKERLSTSKKQDKSPIEIFEYNYAIIKQNIIQEILDKISKISPFVFEKMVVELLLKMGYGGPSQLGDITKKTRDGGIDGIIKEDELGLGKIYVQAKRWENAITSKQIQQFVGALDGKNAKKGIFITTSRFTPDTLKFMDKVVGKDIVLIDGTQLAELLFNHDLGVTPTNVYEIKKIDTEFFDEI